MIHAVGPVYGDPEGDIKLASAVRNSLVKAEELNLRSIALPAISTGIFGYPLNRAASVMADTLKNYEYRKLRKVLVVLYTEEAFKVFERVFDEVLGAQNP